MRPRINPGWFLLKLVALLVVTYMLWAPLAPYYAVFLLRVSQMAVWLTEFSSDPNWQHPTQMLIKLSVSPTALLFYHTHFTQYASGIPAEWVMANMVLLIPLMLATPVVTWRERFVKLGLALLLAVVLQVFDVVVGIKAYYAANVRGAFGPIATEVYQFLDAFVQSWDTQLFPVAIWGAVNFRQLLPERLFAPRASEPAPRPAAPLPRAERRRQRRS